jgi:type I restriction enzyme R subunit
MATAEALARQRIDLLFTTAGCAVQDIRQENIHAARGVAIREFLLNDGFGAERFVWAVSTPASGADLHGTSQVASRETRRELAND